jgi:hypothetical protein
MTKKLSQKRSILSLGRHLTFKRIWRYFKKKPNADYYFSLLAIALLVLSSVLSTLVIPNYDNLIKDKENSLSIAKAKHRHLKL